MNSFLVCLSTPSNPPQFITKVPFKSQHSAGGRGGIVVFGFFWPHCIVCGILVPRPGIEPGPQQWERQILTTRLPGNFQVMGFLKTYWKQSLSWPGFLLFIYLFLAVLGLCCYTGFSLVQRAGGSSLALVLLMAGASLIRSMGSRARRFQ